METYDALVAAIMSAEENQVYTKAGIRPLLTIPKTTRITIVGQAPGLKAQQTGLFWNDPSGDNLRNWLGVSREVFYDSGYFAVLPMDAYYPGKGKSGDLPPRKLFADKWHDSLRSLAPDNQLTILVGNYAQRYYLKERGYRNVTETVKHYKEFLPTYFPLVHPSPRNNIWQAKNPWFMEDVIPDLQERVTDILSQSTSEKG